jgi:hypothetical protein
MPKIGNPVGGPRYKPQWAKDIDARNEPVIATHVHGSRVTPANIPTDSTVGKTPWRAVERHPGMTHGVEVIDADGNPIDFTSPFVAARVCTAVNAWTGLFGDCCNYRDVLRALQAQLTPMRVDPVIKRALDLIEKTLHPEGDLR